MKKILIAFALLVSAPAFAQYHHHGHWQRNHGPYNNGWVWVVPSVLGGVIGYEIAKSQRPIIVQQPEVILPPPPQQTCSPWTEIQNPDGTITRTRTCTQ